MRVSVFGLGYVGSVSAAAFAADGHDVVGVDVSEEKVGMVNAGRSPLVALSRARAGMTARPECTLLINLPGSLAGVASALEVLPELIAHAHSVAQGGDH